MGLDFARHAQENVLHVQNAYDMVQVAIVQREATVPRLINYLHNFRERGIYGDRYKLGARQHHLASREISQVEHAPDHLLLFLFEQSGLPARTDEYLQFLGRVDVRMLVGRGHAKYRQYTVRQNIDYPD